MSRHIAYNKMVTIINKRSNNNKLEGSKLGPHRRAKTLIKWRIFHITDPGMLLVSQESGVSCPSWLIYPGLGAGRGNW